MQSQDLKQSQTKPEDTNEAYQKKVKEAALKAIEMFQPKKDRQ